MLVTELIDTFGVDIDPHLERQVEVPVLTGLQRQGDIIVIPLSMLRVGWNRSPHPVMGPIIHQVSAAGVAVVRGEAGGNTHLLLAAGDVFYDAAEQRPQPVGPRAADPQVAEWGFTDGLGIGALQVNGGATAYLAHPEHGYMGIGPGVYLIRRQREFDGAFQSTRLVAD